MKINITHILPVIMVIILPGLRFYSQEDSGLAVDNPIFSIWLFSSLVLYNLWYFFWFCWEIREGHKKWYVLGLFGALCCLGFLFFEFFEANDMGVLWGLIPPSFLFLVVQYTLKSQKKVSHLLLEKEQLQTENYKAQLKTLRTQVDPHFLFNSLNTLRSMVRQQHSGAEQFILSLSDFYRQSLQHNEHTTVLLSKELKVLQSYLFLMKSRNEEAVRIEVDIEEELLTKEIPTMALQTVVENCFKHNSMTARHPLQVSIKNPDDLSISVCNNIQIKFEEDKTTGMGLELLNKRYELMNIKHGLRVEQTSEQFCVNLKLV